VLAVYKMDRLARSLVHLLSLLTMLEQRGAGFRSLTEPIETGTPAGRLFLQILGSFAEFERALIRERCEAGRVSARARGVRFGRLPVLMGADAELAADLYRHGATINDGAALFGVSYTAFRRALIHQGVVRRFR
jgi:DNA invertase Pin-like site-specific DNA recombinase